MVDVHANYAFIPYIITSFLVDSLNTTGNDVYPQLIINYQPGVKPSPNTGFEISVRLNGTAR
jgi:hypothetical protein